MVRIRVELIVVGLIKFVVFPPPRRFAAEATVSLVNGPIFRPETAINPGRAMGTGEPMRVKSNGLFVFTLVTVGGVGILRVEGETDTLRFVVDDEEDTFGVFFVLLLRVSLLSVLDDTTRGDMGNKYVVTSWTVVTGEDQKLSSIPDNGLAIYTGTGTVCTGTDENEG